MLMAAAPPMVGSAHSSSSSISPPPWHPVILVPNHQQQQVVHHLDLATPSPSPTTPAATATATASNHLRPASRRASKPQRPRRPRPSRKLPTTYISADAASFRRMVHQVTGADDALLSGPAAAPEPGLLLCRKASPSRGALTTTTTTTTTTLTLPTLDTSASFLLGAAARRGADRPGASCCQHGSAVDPGAEPEPEPEACGGGGGGGFLSLESSWDEDDGDALF